MSESTDRALADWLNEGPEQGPREALERTLAATRRVGQRPGWTLPERWIPMDMTLTRTRSQRPLFTIAVLALLTVALSATALYIGQRRVSPSPFRNGAIVFAQDGDLFIADQVGGTPRPLVAGPEEDSDPVFSPRGDRIAFVRDAGRASVMTVRTDGTDLRELAQLPSSVGLQLDWATDGGAILASSDGTFGPSVNGVVLIESDGSGSRTIEAGGYDLSGRAAWRPDGRHIALIAEQKDGMIAVIADADGTNARALPVDPRKSQHTGLAWSPDGTRLALGELFGSTITVVDIDAAGDVISSREVSFGTETSAQPGPSWSPDGSRLAVSLLSGRVGIVAADGSGYQIIGPTLARLTNSTAFWSPDGRSLIVAGSALRKDPETQIWSWAESWSVDVATGEQTEIRTPVDTWQRLAP